jgi:uncharacterized membrane protein YeaQ/YmgE (transglycosylase-associated protein family)
MLNGDHRTAHRRRHHRAAREVLAPGDKDNIPIWLTVLCGIGGVLLGYLISEALDVKETNGIDWLRWAISIALAAVLVIAASTITGRNTRKSVH